MEIYGKLNKDEIIKEYTGVSSSTANVHVDNYANTIMVEMSADVAYKAEVPNQVAIVSTSPTSNKLVLKRNGVELFYTDISGFTQVNSDWNATSGEAEILNKPTVNNNQFAGNQTISTFNNNVVAKTDRFASEDYVDVYGGKIDAIKLNNVTQEIVDKTVNLTVNKNTVGLNNVDNTADIDKPISTLAQNALNLKLNKSNANIAMAKDFSVAVAGDTVSFNKTYRNLDTSIETSSSQVLPLANDNTAGAMSPSDYVQIRNNTTRIEQLEGTTSRLLYITQDTLKNITVAEISYSPAFYINGIIFQIESNNVVEKTGTGAGTIYPISNNKATIKNIEYTFEGLSVGSIITREANAGNINSFAIALGYSVPFRGIAVVIEGTYHIWRYYPNEESAVVIGWKDDGVDTVTQFTNSTPGVILGSASAGKVYAETDGTGSVNGWSTLTQQVATNANNITALQNDKVDKTRTIAGKPLSSDITLGISDISNLQTALNNKQEILSSAQLAAVNSGLSSADKIAIDNLSTNYVTVNSQQNINGVKNFTAIPTVNNVNIASVQAISNKVIAQSDWVVDTTYTDYGYKAEITIQGLTANDFADVVFNQNDVTKMANVALTGANKLTIYSNENSAITIPTILIIKNTVSIPVAIYAITLNTQGATTSGTQTIYEKYNIGYYKDNACTVQMTTSANAITIPEKTGYTFNGYYTEQSGGGTQYINVNGLLANTASTTGFSANGTLYADWTVNHYTLSVYSNNATGGTVKIANGVAGPSATSEIDFNTSTAITAIVSTGYTFEGWWTNAQFTGEPVSTNATMTTSPMTTSGLNYYAKFTADEDIGGGA